MAETLKLPKRIQRKRTKGWRMPENTVYVGRPTVFGNPYKLSKTDQHSDVSRIPLYPVPKSGFILPRDCDAEMILILYEMHVKATLLNYPDFLESLRGKNLACFCSLNSPCHADVLLRLANQGEAALASPVEAK